MAQKIDIPLTESVVIGGDWQIVWAAVDPSTGADVTGVKVTGQNVVATDVSVGSSIPTADLPILLGMAGTG